MRRQQVTYSENYPPRSKLEVEMEIIKAKRAEYYPERKASGDTCRKEWIQWRMDQLRSIITTEVKD